MITEEESIGVFVREIAQAAREMPLTDAACFLRGALAACGPELRAMEPIRTAYRSMVDADNQLELLLSPEAMR